MGEETMREIRRVEHLVFVTLKYTRTVDIIRSALQRMLSAVDWQIQDALEQMKINEKLDTIPTVPLLRCKKLEQLFPKDPVIKDIVDFYHKIKKILAADYRKKEEFRKNVALVTRDEEVNIHMLEDYAHKLKDFLKHLEEITEQ